MREFLTRRDLFDLASRTSAGVTVLAVAACGRSAVVCSDPDKLTDSELTMRTSLQYTEVSPDKRKVCARCVFFAAGSVPCGTCNLLKGPVNAGGHCNSWSPRGA